MNILLDYFFKITSIEPTAAASTAFLKQAAIVVKPNGGGTAGNITLCTSSSAIEAITDNEDAVELLNAGMSKIYVIQSATLDIETVINANASLFYTLLISSDFVDADITDDLEVGTYKGVIGVSSTSKTFLDGQAATELRSPWFTKSANGAKNMAFAFGKLLSNAGNWANQQYVTMPYGDDVNTLGDADDLFDRRISFVIEDSQYGKRLGFFVVGGKAIISPYIEKNLKVDMQSSALTYISANQPQTTPKHASLIEDELEEVIELYKTRGWIEEGTVAITVEDSNFVAAGAINISEPSAFWKINAQLLKTL